MYLGDAPCNAPGNAAAEQLPWGGAVSFTLDCSKDGSGGVREAVRDAVIAKIARAAWNGRAVLEGRR